MWLPKDERHLLAGYFTQFGEITTQKVYQIGNLCELLKVRGYRRRIAEYHDPETSPAIINDDEAFGRDMQTYIRSSKRIKVANKLLAERRLITISPHQSANDVVVISLTLDGYDLGRKYSSFFESSGVWFREYREHWIWLIVSFFGGAIGVKLIDFLRSLFNDP